MKDNIDILNSKISDELLAAYIDGNLTENKNALIENSLNEDSMLSETYEIAHDGVSFGSDFDWDFNKGDFGLWEIGLSPAVTESDLTIAADTSYDDITEGADFNPNLDTHNPLDDGFTPLDTSTLDDLLNSDISEGLEDVDDLGNTLL